jgi:hypothetical protein
MRYEYSITLVSTPPFPFPNLDGHQVLFTARTAVLLGQEGDTSELTRSRPMARATVYRP